MQHLRWVLTRSRKPNLNDFQVHLLCVTDPVYVRIARVCVESFLYHHPTAKLHLHCDESTFDAATDLFGKSRTRRRVSVEPTFRAEAGPWQRQKIDLILSMQGTADLFLDADLRWNGPLPDLSGVTLFVNEFDMVQRSPYRQLVRAIAPSLPIAYMFNTSFFTFSGHDLGPEAAASIRESVERFPDTIEQANLGHLDIEGLMRIREQIVLSIALQVAKAEVRTLKEGDAVRDGEYVESTYFGATGQEF